MDHINWWGESIRWDNTYFACLFPALLTMTMLHETRIAPSPPQHKVIYDRRQHITPFYYPVSKPHHTTIMIILAFYDIPTPCAPLRVFCSVLWHFLHANSVACPCKKNYNDFVRALHFFFCWSTLGMGILYSRSIFSMLFYLPPKLLADQKKKKKPHFFLCNNPKLFERRRVCIVSSCVISTQPEQNTI